MSQQNNPFAKFIKDPRSIPDPKTITIDQLKNYQSYEMNKINLSWKVHKKSAMYIGGCLGLMLISSLFAEKAARHNLFGADNRGGSLLDLKTVHDESHYAYNREFQRMMLLTETHTPNVSTISTNLLDDLGVNPPKGGLRTATKRAPHEKYY
jgi:hypothetical protein